MKRRLLRRTHQEPSLVPLADMLSNTVGIMIFILIFTVLASGGAVIPKFFPIEQKTDKKPLIYMCAHNNIIAEEIYGASDVFETEKIKPLLEELQACLRKSKPVRRDWMKDYNNQAMETENFTFKALGGFFSQSLHLIMSLEPRADAGETVETLKREESRFVRELSARNPKERFVYFMVYPDSTEVFTLARKLARERGFGVGWGPMKSGDQVRISLTGQGEAPIPQDNI